jgi:RND superfamily putative drug exporter
MKLLGRWNWYLPSWLSWIPRVGQEPKALPDGSEIPPRRPTTDSMPVLQPAAYPELAVESVA